MYAIATCFTRIIQRIYFVSNLQFAPKTKAYQVSYMSYVQKPHISISAPSTSGTLLKQLLKTAMCTYRELQKIGEHHTGQVKEGNMLITLHIQ